MARTDRASLLLHVDRATVFAALVDADALARWLPPSGMHGRFEEFDLREGGFWRLVLTYDDPTDAPGKTSADADVSEVRIVRLMPGERIVQQVDFQTDVAEFQGTMELEWSLQSVDEGTEVTIEARNVPVGITASDHAVGMTSSLANLATYLERPDA